MGQGGGGAGDPCGVEGDQEPAVATTSSSGGGGGILQLELLAAAGVPCKVAAQSAGSTIPLVRLGWPRSQGAGKPCGVLAL